MDKEDKPQRKSKRKFDLSKPQRRAFNLDKGDKANSVDEASEQQPATSIPQNAQAASGKGESKKWVGWIIALIVVVVVVLLMVLKPFSTNKVEQASPSDTTVTTQPKPAASDTTNAGPQQDESSATSPAPSSNAPQEESNRQTTATKPKAVSSLQSAPVASDEINVSSDNLDVVARRVISGEFGNVPERRHLLGSKFKAVQRRVNEMYRKGLVK